MLHQFFVVIIWERKYLFRELIDFCFVQNVDLPGWYFTVVILIQIGSLLSSAGFLGLLIWSIVLFIREKKLDSASRKFLPKVLGFSFALALALTGLALSLVYLS